jgi:ATP synthase protein I
MVRAAFKGDGAQFPFPRASDRVSSTWQPRTGSKDMAEGTNDNGNGSRDKSPDEAALSARLGSLDRRLSKIRGSRNIGTDQVGGQSEDGAARASAMAIGFRLSSELVAGVVVGVVIGWGFDRLLSTSPFGLIVFVLLGFVAGVVNVVRSAGKLSGNR